MIRIIDKSGAVLRYFDADTLSGANLSGSDLRGAYLNRWQGRNGIVGNVTLGKRNHGVKL